MRVSGKVFVGSNNNIAWNYGCEKVGVAGPIQCPTGPLGPHGLHGPIGYSIGPARPICLPPQSDALLLLFPTGTFPDTAICYFVLCYPSGGNLHPRNHKWILHPNRCYLFYWFVNIRIAPNERAWSLYAKKTNIVSFEPVGVPDPGWKCNRIINLVQGLGAVLT